MQDLKQDLNPKYFGKSDPDLHKKTVRIDNTAAWSETGLKVGFRSHSENLYL